MFKANIGESSKVIHSCNVQCKRLASLSGYREPRKEYLYVYTSFGKYSRYKCLYGTGIYKYSCAVRLFAFLAVPEKFNGTLNLRCV